MNNIPSIGEQEERGLKILESANPELATYASREDAIKAYRDAFEVAIYIGPSHPLSLIKWALQQSCGEEDKFQYYKNRINVLGEKATQTVIDGTVIKHFQTIEEKQLFMEGVDCTNTSYHEIDSEVADFLEQYLSDPNASND